MRKKKLTYIVQKSLATGKEELYPLTYSIIKAIADFNRRLTYEEVLDRFNKGEAIETPASIYTVREI